MDWAERIGRRIKLRDLHVLLAVSQHGSMVRAASHLAISQPVVSKVIAEMEAVIGSKLLERSRSGIELTEAGRVLLRCGIVVFDELKQGVREIESLADPTAGELRIAGPGTVVGGLFPAVMERLSRSHPRMTFRVSQVTDVAQQMQELRERKVDLVVRRQPEGMLDKSGLAAEILFNDPPLIAAGSNNPWVRRRNIKLAELMDEPWVLPPPETDVGPYIKELFGQAGLGVPSAKIVAASMDLNHALLSTGRYLAIYPHSLLMFAGKRLAIKKLAVEVPEKIMEFSAIYLKRRPLSAAAKLFISCARELSAPLAKQLAGRRLPNI